MHLIRFSADAFGLVTIALVSIAAFLGLLCIYSSIYFQLWIRNRHYLQLSYFNGPWFTRIVLILVAIWWGFGEIVRLTLLKGDERLFTSIRCQKDICKFYIISNLGFAEPCMFLMITFLLHASLQKRESGTLSPRWNRKTVSYVLFCSLPVFIMQLCIVVIGPKFTVQNGNLKTMVAKFVLSSSMNEQVSVCTYPLGSTMILGLFHTILVFYISCVGAKVVSLVINKGLQQRIFLLIVSVMVLLPMRVLLLASSVLPHKGHLFFESLIFTSFLAVLLCVLIGISMLVYFPISDSLALGDLGNIGLEDIPYDDYFRDGNGGAPLVAHQSHQVTWRNNPDSFTKHVSISFHPSIKDEPLASGSEDFNSVPLK
ncbi:hypothetical protein IHE45_10G049700 [Dioscorea alata]|uniref:Uncharacterized protein n=1 Tax=Dioscorea alata TaxID=55571 RepID=A0ACB7VAZ1_DIOAL|nr:hypothetical protein IHE45_10G049700 [Dioscorea alata]